MTKFYSTDGAKAQTARGAAHIDKGKQNSGLVRFVTDAKPLEASMASGDQLFLASIPSHARLHPVASYLAFDDIGTSITGAIGCDDTEQAAYLTGSSNALATGIDMSTAAGQVSAVGSVAIENRSKMLWEQLGLTRDPRAKINLYLTIAGAGDPNTGDVQWEFCGTV